MTFYEILEIDPRASVVEIERAFRQRARKVHPDLNSGDLRGAEARMKLLNEIRDTLTDPLRRAVYDAELLNEAAARTRVAPPRAAPIFEPVTPAPSDEMSWDDGAPPAFVKWTTRAFLAAAVAWLSTTAFKEMRTKKNEATATTTTTPPVPAIAPPPPSPSEPRPRVEAPKRARRAVVRIGTRADDVIRKLGAPDRVEPGRQSGDAVFHYGALRLEIKNGRVARGDAAD